MLNLNNLDSSLTTMDEQQPLQDRMYSILGGECDMRKGLQVQ